MKILALFVLLLSINGCSNKPNTITIPGWGKYYNKPKILIKKKFIRSKRRTLVNLPKISSYIITDIETLDDKYFKVNKIQMAKSAKVCQRKTRKIEFYERQNDGYKN